jgi:hypothetical protein
MLFVTNELEKEGCDLIGLLSWYLPGGTKGTYEQSSQESEPRFWSRHLPMVKQIY